MKWLTIDLVIEAIAMVCEPIVLEQPLFMFQFSYMLLLRGLILVMDEYMS